MGAPKCVATWPGCVQLMAPAWPLKGRALHAPHPHSCQAPAHKMCKAACDESTVHTMTSRMPAGACVSSIHMWRAGWRAGFEELLLPFSQLCCSSPHCRAHSHPAPWAAPLEQARRISRRHAHLHAAASWQPRPTCPPCWSHYQTPGPHAARGQHMCTAPPNPAATLQGTRAANAAGAGPATHPGSGAPVGCCVFACKWTAAAGSAAVLQRCLPELGGV
jgi:hypothetical protein